MKYIIYDGLFLLNFGFRFVNRFVLLNYLFIIGNYNYAIRFKNKAA